MALSKPTNNSNADYANRIGLLFDAFNNGNYAFPATQVPSADPNTLDDYEEGTWTPVFTFATPGNLVVAYAFRVAEYTKIGRSVLAALNVQTSTFTHTTASGNFQITGLPFANGSSCPYEAAALWQGITKAGYTDVVLQVSASMLQLGASGSASSATNIAPADMPTGGTVRVSAGFNYRV